MLEREGRTERQRISSLSTPTTSDFVFLNGKAKFCTVEITETDVTLTYKVPGLMMIVR